MVCMFVLYSLNRYLATLIPKALRIGTHRTFSIIVFISVGRYEQVVEDIISIELSFKHLMYKTYGFQLLIISIYSA